MKISKIAKINEIDLRPKKLISKLKSYKQRTKASYVPPQTLSGHSLTYMEVKHLTPEKVEESIERFVLDIAHSIEDDEPGGYAFTFPSRALTNSAYLDDLRRFVLMYAEIRCSYTSSSSRARAIMMARILEIVYQLSRCGIHITKRDLFYTDVKLFENQPRSDDALEDATCMIGCIRNDLHILAAERGVVIGCLTFRENDDTINCRKMGNGGKSIPPDIDCVEIVESESDALFILIVEKDTVFLRLAQVRFHKKYRCIIITGKGYPDMATRALVNKLYNTLKIPVFVLTDCDPHGIHIASVYKYGSKNMSYDNGRLVTPEAVWLGLKYADLDDLGVPIGCRSPLTKEDTSFAKSLLEAGFIGENKDWKKQLKNMLKYNEKAQIESLSNFDFNYLTDVYIPRQLYMSIEGKSN